MKKLLYLWIVLFCLVGCRRQEPTLTATLLHQAERCMDAHPDSALLLLNTIASPTSLQGKEQAEYALLFTQAMDKCGRLGHNDSLIRIAVEYYKEKDDELKAAKSLFYWGLVLKRNNQSIEAIEAFLETLKKMPKGIDDRTIPLAYHYLANEYSTQGMYTESIEMYQKSLTAFLNRKDTLDISYSYRGMANVYLLQEKTDSALLFYQKALGIAEKFDNRVLEADISIGLAKLFLYQKRDIPMAYKP